MTQTSTSTLTDSISSLGSASPSRTPSISRTYKQASQLFLTRQFAETWEVLAPLVSPEPSAGRSEGTFGDGGFGLGVGGEDTNGTSNGNSHDSHSPSKAPPQSQVATASKSARVKVWSLWLALVNELLQLGPEDGARVLGQLEQQGGKSGAKRWRELVRKVQEGDIWEDCVNVGYGGNEAAVDGEVVANLATLLLSHALSQSLTQSRLETYLSAATSGPSPAQLASRLDSASPTSSTPSTTTTETNGTSSSNGHTNGNTTHLSHPTQNGTSTPADLTTRLKLLEIYTLHVLPRNQEWDYAREFITLSEILDEDRKEAFLAALGGLREEADLAGKAESELQKQRLAQEEEAKRREVESEKRREEEERNRKTAAEMGLRRQEEETARNTRANGATAHRRAPSEKGREKEKEKERKDKRSSPSSSRPAKRPRPQSPRSNFLNRATHTLAALQKVLLQMGTSIVQNPIVVLRMLFFVVALVFALGRRDVRERVGRAWEKVRGTVGMGVRTTYL